MALICSQRVACVPLHQPRPTLAFALPTTRPNRTNVVVRNSDSGATTSELASELTGTTLLQFIAGAAPAAVSVPASGLGLMALVFAFGNASGAQLNPAVSLMLLLRKKMSTGKALAYMAAQVAGCTLGALLCTWFIPGVHVGQGLAAPGTYSPMSGLSRPMVFAWEALMTCFLALTVYGCAVANSAFKAAAPVGIAAALAAAIMMAGQYTGCVINPARALGPSIVFGLSSSNTLLYVAAQLTGAALAALLTKLIHKD